MSAAAEPEGADGLAEVRGAPKCDVLVAADQVGEDGVKAMLEQMVAHTNGAAPPNDRQPGVMGDPTRAFVTAAPDFEGRGQP